MPPRAPADRLLASDGCALALLVPAEVAFGLVWAAVLMLTHRPGAATAWLAGMALAALAAAVFFFRDGYRVTGVAQVLATVFFLILMLDVGSR
ncbi:hypothetical protein [Streptomyces justiciae]|uniref:hypothetical protein n=1 Tax=Streptomyces justiciae TaxID=2780140 RepID=UPI0018822CD4|nr:hypothetical protein [Streptomyces justiciae]MBE8474452.1 hypothetical protein [Streptomyces justiciae]